MGKYIVTSRCESQINEIVNYIAEDNVDAAIDFYERLKALFRLISQNPKMGRERPELAEGLRSFPVGKYVVFYRIWAGEVAIVRVVDGARDLEQLFG